MVGIIAGAGAISAIMVGNFLFAILIAVGALSIAIHAGKKPDLKEFKIDSRGIYVGERLYPYESIDSFWFDEKTPQLFFELRRPFIPLMIIPVSAENHDEIQKILMARLEEREHEIPLSHQVLDYFGF